MRTFLIVEDNPTKAQSFLRFGQVHAEPRGIRLRARSSPAGALNLLLDPEQRAGIDGVIADFELGCRRDDNSAFRAHASRADGTPYTVSTGMGVLDWVHTTMDPDMPLWALTNDAATHAPLYMAAANLWLNAHPLHIDRLSPALDSSAAEAMVDEFLDPDDYETLNPHGDRIDNASLAMGELLDTDYVRTEAFDWLHALTHMTVGTEGFVPAVSRSIQRVTNNSKLKAHSNTLAPAMALWQLLLDEIYSEFPVERREELWPQLDRDNLPKSLQPWAEFNPITGFFGQQPECREFFGSEDVRVALTNWRARERS